MIKRIIGILAVIAAVLTLTAAQPAAAASNGTVIGLSGCAQSR